MAADLPLNNVRAARGDVVNVHDVPPFIALSTCTYIAAADRIVRKDFACFLREIGAL
jgi:hypothetical protein